MPASLSWVTKSGLISELDLIQNLRLSTRTFDCNRRSGGASSSRFNNAVLEVERHGEEERKAGSTRSGHRDRRGRSQGHRRGLERAAGRQLRALPEDARVSLERDRADVPDAAPHVRDPLQRAVAGERP